MFINKRLLHWRLSNIGCNPWKQPGKTFVSRKRLYWWPTFGPVWICRFFRYTLTNNIYRLHINSVHKMILCSIRAIQTLASPSHSSSSSTTGFAGQQTGSSSVATRAAGSSIFSVGNIQLSLPAVADQLAGHILSKVVLFPLQVHYFTMVFFMIVLCVVAVRDRLWVPKQCLGRQQEAFLGNSDNNACSFLNRSNHWATPCRTAHNTEAQVTQ